MDKITKADINKLKQLIKDLNLPKTSYKERRKI